MFFEEKFSKTIGILGGGQLAQMLARSGKKLGFNIEIFSEEIDPCSKNDANVTVSQFLYFQELDIFAKKCDFLTIETENIPINALNFLWKRHQDKMTFNPSFIEIAQHRLKEKTFANSIGITTAKFQKIETIAEIVEFFHQNGECILKTSTQGYDGKGQFRISKITDIPQKLECVEYIIEKLVPFEFEISTIATKQGSELQIFPIPQNIHKNGILHTSQVPMVCENFTENQITQIQKTANNYATTVAQNINYNGTFAIEFFVLQSGDLIFNEMAPRVHNSGHFSQNLCNVCQFENHIRAITGLKVLQPALLFQGTMLNIIGNDIKQLHNFLDKPNHLIHLYGKSLKIGRKMGHINIIE